MVFNPTLVLFLVARAVMYAACFFVAATAFVWPKTHPQTGGLSRLDHLSFWFYVWGAGWGLSLVMQGLGLLPNTGLAVAYGLVGLASAGLAVALMRFRLPATSVIPTRINPRLVWLATALVLLVLTLLSRTGLI